MQQLEMVFNELSLGTISGDRPVTTDKYKARELMSTFIETLSTAVSSGVTVLRTQIDIYSILLSPSYPIANWVNDNEIDEVESTFLLTLETERPLLSNLADPEITNQIGLFECLHNGREANGLGIAYLLESLPVSFNSDRRWDCHILALDIRQIDDLGELIDERVEIVHASRSSHIHTHETWIKNRTRIRINDGRELWERRGELFPHLEFCEAVAPQLDALQPGNPMLKQVLKRLFELEESSKNWMAGNFDLDSLPSKATPESDSRLNQLKRQLTIPCLDGNERLFSLHLRMTPGAWRLYFSTEGGPQKILIGYIGRKIQ